MLHIHVFLAAPLRARYMAQPRADTQWSNKKHMSMKH